MKQIICLLFLIFVIASCATMFEDPAAKAEAEARLRELEELQQEFAAQ